MLNLVRQEGTGRSLAGTGGIAGFGLRQVNPTIPLMSQGGNEKGVAAKSYCR
jgi:hypothetical protein